MRRVVPSRTYVAQLQVFIEQGIATFGLAAANRTLTRIERTIEHVANFPASRKPAPSSN